MIKTPELIGSGSQSKALASRNGHDSSVLHDGAPCAPNGAELRRGQTPARTEAHFRQLVGLMPAGVYTCEAPSGVITFFNEQAARLWGRAPRLGDTEERFCGALRLWLPNGDRLPHDETPMAMALREGRAFRNLNVIVERPDGARITVLVNIDPIRNEHGEVTGAINVFQDTTALKEAEQTLRENERRLRQMIDALPTAIYTTDAEGRLTHFNPAAVEFSGRIPELGTDQWCVTWKLYQADGTPMAHSECPMAIALKEGRILHGVEAIAERPDGKRIWFTPYPTPLRDESGKIIGGINMLVDITERKKAEQASARLAAIVESSEDAIISKDLDGIIKSWNRAAEQLFGYSADEAVGQPITMLIPKERLHEESTIIGRIKRGERIEHFETVRRRKDGSQIDISLTISPVKASNGRIIGVSKVARDITERKKAERELLEARHQLQRHSEELEKTIAARTAALQASNEQLEAFVYSIAHDLRAPLRTMIAYSELLVDEHAADLKEPAERMLKRIQVSSAFMDRLLVDLLAYGRTARAELELGRVDVGKAWEAALFQHAHEIEKLRAQIETARPLPAVRAHEATLAQILANLLGNSLKFVGDGVTPRVRFRAEGHGDTIRLWVEDNGLGIPPEQHERVFRVFERMNGSRYPGTGIGLSIVRKGAERMGGKVGVQSESGRGSRFWVDLPKAD